MSQCETALQSHAINVWYWVWRRMVVLEFAVWVSNQGFRSSSSLGLGRKAKIDSSLCVWSSPLLLKHLLAEIMWWNPELMDANAYFTMDFRARLLRDLQPMISRSWCHTAWQPAAPCLGTWDGPALSSSQGSHVVTEKGLLLPWADPLLQAPFISHLPKNLPSDRLASLKQPLEKSPLPVRPLCATLLLQMFSRCLFSLLLDLSCNICLIQIAFSAHWPSCISASPRIQLYWSSLHPFSLSSVGTIEQCWYISHLTFLAESLAYIPCYSMHLRDGEVRF